jgi:N-acetylmuramoyl-L-alanine amidase
MIMPTPPGRLFTLTAAAVVLLFASAASAFAQNAATLYQRAHAREDALARAKSPAVPDLRAVAAAYENIVRRFPTSGYADNALWQAAGLYRAAFERSRQPADAQKAVTLLNWLRNEYPSSSLVAQATAQLAALETPAAETRPAAVDPPPAVAAQPLPAPPTPPPAPHEPPASAADRSGPPAAIRNISVVPLPRGERITIELNREVSISGDRVSNPERVFFDFPNASAPGSVVDRAQQLTGRLLRGVRLGHPTSGTTRVVLELHGSPRHSSFPLYDPFRLVIDIETDTILTPGPGPVLPPPVAANAPAPVEDVAAAKKPAETPGPPARETVPPAPAAITRSGDYSLARQLGLGIARIVIDPGHGGHDPGAIANSVREAELVLDIALRLETLLKQKSGFDVVLTRRTNEFIPLEERTAIANREKADLFLSIHANAGRNTAARGVETYYLNFATNPEAEAVAARENATSAQTMGTLPSILRAIALNNKLAESRELATILQTSMVRRLRGHNTGLRDLGVKQAPFVVLIGAQMPSVLAEVSFVTNRAEASLLKQAAYRQHIAQALCDAIVKYQGSLKKITTAPAASPAR